MNVGPETAYRFLRVFARAEFALKRTRPYCGGAESEKASAEWSAFGRDIEHDFMQRQELSPDIRELLLVDPPHKEVVENGVSVMRHRDLEGGNSCQNILISVRRVRNNLIHGGKELEERCPGHDEALVRAATVALDAAIDCNHDVSYHYHG